MKRRNGNQGRHWLWAVLFMIGISGCTDESLRGDAGRDEGLASGKTGYIVLDIAADSGGATTRAWGDGQAGEAGDDEFDPGDAGEQAMAPDPGAHWVIFFNEDGSFHSMQELLESYETDPNAEDHPGADQETVIGGFIGRFETGDGYSLPKKLLVVLNADPDIMGEIQSEFTEGEKGAAEALLSRLTERMSNEVFKTGDMPVIFYTPDGTTNYCTMSNTTYAGDGNRVITLQDIPEGAIQDTPEQAAANPVRVHVERLAVKVELSVKGEIFNEPIEIKPEPDPDDSYGNPQQKDTDEGEARPVEWSVLIRGWSTSGIARRMYLFKNLNDQKEDADGAGPTAVLSHYGNGNITTPFFSNWNAWERFRCYWAVDDRYRDPSVYPTQYREAKDKEPSTKPYDGLYGTGDSEDGNSPLYYYSYNEITNLSEGKTPNGGEIKGNLLSGKEHRYCPENTLGEELLEETIYRSASTHVIITAQLLFNGDDAEAAKNSPDAVTDKYHADGYWWNLDGYIRHAYNRLYNALKAGRSFKDIFGGGEDVQVPANAKIYAVKDGVETELTGDFLSGDKTEDEIPFTLAEARIVGGDGREMLALKEGWTLKVTDADGGNPVNIDADKFLSMVYAFVGYTDLFRQGMMYYWVPIRHVQGGDRADGWKLGDIGVVRNHWYKLNVMSVKRPGIPVDDPEDPIIPHEPEPTDAYLGLEVRILPWHIIEQNVDLK